MRRSSMAVIIGDAFQAPRLRPSCLKLYQVRPLASTTRWLERSNRSLALKLGLQAWPFKGAWVSYVKHSAGYFVRITVRTWIAQVVLCRPASSRMRACQRRRGHDMSHRSHETRPKT